MKIRNGFVSNSSSSSFVIAFKESKPCKCCGRKDLDLLDMLEKTSNRSDSTEVKYCCYDELKRKIDDSIKTLKKDLDEIKNNKLYPFVPCSPYYAKDVPSYKKYIERELDSCNEFFKDLEEIMKDKRNKWKVIGFDLSYHDQFIFDTLENMVKSGNVIIIRTDSSSFKDNYEYEGKDFPSYSF